MFFTIASIRTKAFKNSTFLIIIIILLSSCAAQKRLTQKLPKGGLPHFDGPIIPISKHVKLKYSPSRIDFQVSTIEMAELFDLDLCKLLFIGQPLSKIACENDVEKFGNKAQIINETTVTSGNIIVTRWGENLVWDVRTLQVTRGDQVWKPSLPINSVWVLSDCRCKVREIEISFPALEKAQAQDIPKPGTQEYKKAVNLFRQSFLPLPEKPVRTGNALCSFSLSAIVGEMLSFWGEVNGQSILHILEDNGQTLKYEVKGWSYFNERKVLVAELDFSGTIKVGDQTMNVKNAGFVLLDAVSGHMLAREHLSHMKYGKSQFKVCHKTVSQIRGGE
jgi:hypothetical protein